MSDRGPSMSRERIALTIAEREALRAARKKAGLRGKVLARRLGVTLGALNKYESGERRPTSALVSAWWGVLIGWLPLAAE